MKTTVHRVLATRTAEPETVLDEIDISSDPALIELYGLEIPVLLIDGRKAAKYRVSEQELTQLLDRRRG